MFTNYETINTSNIPFSLIKYQPPVQITYKLEAYEKAKIIEKNRQSKPSAQDILNTMLTPRQWKNVQGQYFMQYVSHSKPQREDVEKAQSSLENSLVQMQAKTQGICPIRQYLFSQMFDELIRQVAINCCERGLMLLRLRDERKMTIAAYQTLYQEGKTYGMKKQHQAQEGMLQLQANLSTAQFRKSQLQRKKIQLLSKKGSMQQKIRQRKTLQNEKREYQVSAIKKQNEYLQLFIEKRRMLVKQRQEALKQKQEEDEQ